MMQYDQLLQNQRSFFQSGKTRDLKFRKKNLQILRDAITGNEDILTEALYNDLRKSRFEAVTAEIMTLLDEIDHHLKYLDSWMKPESVRPNLVSLPSSNTIRRVPFGVAYIIGAWNYPVQLSLMPLIGAISAGNCAVVKPSELSPHTSSALSELINNRFKRDYVTVVEGGVEVSQELLELNFDKIFFTGSTRVGKIVMQKAAQNLTPVTLELGGKSPAVVHKDADIKTAARRIIWGKMMNTGQTCIAPDFALVHSDIKSELLKYAAESIQNFYGTDPQKSDDYGRIINQKHFDRITGLLKDVNIVHGGKSDQTDLYIEPTIIEGAGLDHPVMNEEIFGPLLPVLTFDQPDDAIELLRKLPAPLAFYIFSENDKFVQNLTENLPHGGACINDVIMHISNTNLPFGGVGNSGMGQYHGQYSYECFTRPQAMMKRKTWPDPSFRYPPFGNRLSLLKKLIIR